MDVLTAQEAALYLKISPQFVRKLIHRGEIKALRFGRIWRIERNDLDAYVQANRVG